MEYLKQLPTQIICRLCFSLLVILEQQIQYKIRQNDQVAPIPYYKKQKMNPIMLSYIGHIQGKVYSALSQDNKKLVTVGTDDLIIQWQTQDMTSRRQIQMPNKTGQIYTCIQYLQQNKIFVLGTESGNVWLMNENNLNDSKLAYQSSIHAAIKNIKLSKSLKYLAIASGQDRAVVYDIQKQRYYRCDSGHEGIVTYADICYEDRILASLASDGYTNIYALQPSTINPVQMLHKYRMCHSPQIQPYTNFSQHPTQPHHLTYSGVTTLQQLYLSLNESSPQDLTQIQCEYKIKVQIHEQSEIFSVCWFNQNVLVVCLENSVNLWNYVTKDRFHVLRNLDVREVVSDGIRFYGVGGTGIVYRYDNTSNIHFQNQQAKKYLQNLSNQTNNNNNNINNDQIQQQPQYTNKKPPQKQLQQPQISGQLISKYPQRSIQSYYPSHVQFQFIFYNQHGCIIKHINGDQQIMQLQYHDKFKLRKIKFQSNGKYYYHYFALNARCFMYSSLNHVFFQMENERRGKTADNGLIKWDYKIDGIQGVAIGNTWVVVACNDCVRLFDLYGNQLFVISHSRSFLTMAAYEDILVLGYNAAIPLAECHMFELKVYKVSNQSVKLQKKIKMPIKAEHQLKAFGFSEEGYLYNQDTSQTVRMYCWDTNQWINIYKENANQHKLYIQHLENYEIYGFKIQQKEGEPTGPTVLPRSLPRKILYQFSQQKQTYLTEQENKRLQNIYLRKLKILHQGFRSRRWYKNKYARKDTNSLYKLSEKILSEQQIQQEKSQIDIYIVDQVKKILPNLQTRLSGSQIQEVKFQLLALCHQLVYYQESINKITSILGLGNPLASYWDIQQIEQKKITKKYHQLDRLGAMVDMGWIQRTMD